MEAFSLADHDERKDLLEAARKQEAGKRQARGPAPAAARGAPSTGDADTGPDDVAAPAKETPPSPPQAGEVRAPVQPAAEPPSERPSALAAAPRFRACIGLRGNLG